MISEVVAAEIRRLFEVEGWRRSTIARHLGIHHGTVDRALRRAGVLPQHPPACRPSKLDAYVPFVRATLERYLAGRRMGAEIGELGRGKRSQTTT